MLGDLLLKTVEKYVDVFIDTLATKYDLPKTELKGMWKEIIGAGKKKEKAYKKMKLDELQNLCTERGIFLKKSRKKQLYIDALEENDKAPKDAVVEEGEPTVVDEPVVEEAPVEQPLVDEPVVEEETVVDEPVVKEVPVEQTVVEEVEQPLVDETVVEEAAVEQKVVEEKEASKPLVEEKKTSKKNKTSPKPKKSETIEDYVEKIQSMEDSKDVHDMNFTELKKFCKEKGMDTRQKTKQQLLDWVDEKEKTTDFSEFLTDVNDLI